MTLAGRAAIGAAIGAVLALIGDPLSRPYILSAFQRSSARKVLFALRADRSHLPAPSNRVAAGLWLLTASERMTGSQRLSAKETATLLQIAHNAATADPDNAFWPQMRAVLLHESGKDSDALAQWLRASRCKMWDDLQTDRLLQDRAKVAHLLSSNQSWIYGFVYFDRSDTTARLIHEYSRFLISHSNPTSQADLIIRYATLLNGSLLRDGSRSLKVGESGAKIVELASYPPSLSEEMKKPKHLYLAITAFTERLRSAQLFDESDRARKAFRDNEAWRTLTRLEAPEETVRSLCVSAVCLSVLPGAMAMASLCGLVAYSSGRLNQLRLAKMRLFPLAGIGGASILSGIGLYGATHSWVAGLAVGAELSFLAIGPFNPRTRKVDDLGPFFSFMIFCIWFFGACGLVALVTSISTASACLLPPLGPVGDYLTDSSMFASVTAIVLSLLCLITPAWAIVHRYGTPDLLGFALQRFGRTACLGSLGLCILVGPATVYADNRCRTVLEEIVRNEPVYYLTKK